MLSSPALVGSRPRPPVTSPARIAALHRAAELLLGANDGDVRALGADLLVWLHHGGGNLEEALGIGGQQSQRTWRTMAAIEGRNTALRIAAQRFRLGAGELAVEMARYHSTGWRHDKAAPVCPQRLTGTVRELLWIALRARDHALGERALRDVLRGSERPGLIAGTTCYQESEKEVAQ
jgi:hypothetical protein